MILWILACVDPEPVIADSGAALPQVDRPAEAAVWTAPEIQEELQGLLAQGFPSPWRGLEIYLDVLSKGDETCPGHETYIDDSALRGCTASTGWWYSGVSSFEQVNEEFQGQQVEFVAAVGDFLVIDPLGNELECGGHQSAGRVFADDGSLMEIFGEHSGSYVWQGDEGLYREPVSGALQIGLGGSAGEHQVQLSGSVRYLERSLYFKMRLSEQCGWSAEQGSLLLRDPSGAWVSWSPESCESCAPAVFSDGTELGEVCLDLSPIAAVYAEELELLP